MARFWKKESPFDEPIDKVLEEMRQHDHETEEYKLALAQLGLLVTMKNESSDKINKNTLLLVAGAVLQVVIIVAYEQKNVLTSAAKNLILRPGT